MITWALLFNLTFDMQNPSTELIYVADPMCSWCYGFGPQLATVQEATGLPVRLVMGGLYVGDRAQPATPGLRQYLEETWDRVESRTGQPFRFDHAEPLVQGDWMYDTAPSAQAVIHVRDKTPDRALAYLGAVQRAFYFDGRDVTKWEVLESIGQELGLGSIASIDSLLNPGSLEKDMAESLALGANGYPKVILGTSYPDGRVDHVPVATGFTRASDVQRKIQVLLTP